MEVKVKELSCLNSNKGKPSRTTESKNSGNRAREQTYKFRGQKELRLNTRESSQ